MANLEPELKDDEPLDPVMENVRRKMVRLQLVSGGIMFVSLMAVLIAVVYKAKNSGEAANAGVAAPVTAGFAVPADQPLRTTAQLPAGFEILSVSQSGGQLLFYGTLNGERKALIFDLGVGRVIADVSIAGR
jgi:hypothetical protein